MMARVVRAWMGTCLLLLCVMEGAATTQAQDLRTSYEDLIGYRDALRGESEQRAEALRAYSRLSSEAEPVIRRRVKEIRSQIRSHSSAISDADAQRQDAESAPDVQLLAAGDQAAAALDALADAITEFRKAAGGELANDIVDIAVGVAPALEQKPGRADAAEIILLARALERIGSPQAIDALGDLLASHHGLFRWELTRLITLRKERFIPFLIAWQNHTQGWVASKSQDALADMKVTSAGRAFALAPDAEQLLQTLAVYQHQRSFDAMEAVASLMNHPAIGVRTNARKFMRWYGRNGIWQLRRLYRNQRGEDAPKSWGWKRVYAEVLAKMRDDSAFRLPQGAIVSDEAKDVELPAQRTKRGGDVAEADDVAEGAERVSSSKPGVSDPATRPQPRRTGPNFFVLGLAAVLVVGGGYWSMRARAS